MKRVILFLTLISALFAEKPIIKVEGEELFKALFYTENSPYVKLYDWYIGDGMANIIEWDPNGNNWTPEGFERRGKVYLTTQGKITHTVVGKEVKPGYWDLVMLGNRDKIIQAKLSPSSTTMENPSLFIEKSFIQEKIVCEENNHLRDTVYLVKFPNKVPSWVEEKTIFSQKGNRSEYSISFDKKPLCALKGERDKKSHTSSKISDTIKQQIKLFLVSFYKSGEESFPTKALHYYASKVDRYFSMKNVTKEDILEDKIRYYKKWTKRKYTLKDFEIIDTYVVDSVRYYTVSSIIDWHLVSSKGKVRQDTSYNLITLFENENGFLIKSIKTMGGTSTPSVHSKEEASVNTKESLKYVSTTNSAKQKTISFQEKGIAISVTYPSFVKAGQKFKIRAEMINNTRNAKQGGLTLSFPDMRSMGGQILRNNFTSLKGYSTPNRIYNKRTRRTMITDYFMVEGWQSRVWKSGRTKYFTVELQAPKGLDKLLVNVRGVLWIRSKYDTREIPKYSSLYDQQGFSVKQFSIRIQ
jgi:hypothetical protein